MSKVTSSLLRQGDIIGWEGHNFYPVRSTWPKGNRQIEIEGNPTKKSTFYKCQDNRRLGVCASGRESRAGTTRHNGWFWLEQPLDIKPDKDTARKLQASVPGGHRCKSPQRNNSKPNQQYARRIVHLVKWDLFQGRKGGLQIKHCDAPRLM